MAIERPGKQVTLPSLGLPYEGKIPGGQCTVYSMKTVDEKLFAGINKRMDFEDVIDQLIARCTDIKDLPPRELYLGDRLYLMMAIRMVSYGVNYAFQAGCPSCNARQQYDVNLESDLEVKFADEAVWADPVEVTLPYSGDKVSIRLFRGDDERKIIKYADQQLKGKAALGDPAYVFRLALHVIQVVSNEAERTIMPDPKGVINKAIRYIENLDAPDSSAIRDAIEEHTPGLMMALNLSCRSCGNTYDLTLPMSGDFFRSRTSSGVRS